MGKFPSAGRLNGVRLDYLCVDGTTYASAKTRNDIMCPLTGGSALRENNLLVHVAVDASIEDLHHDTVGVPQPAQKKAPPRYGPQAIRCL